MKIRKAKKGDLKEISKIFMEESNKKPYTQGWTKKTALNNISKSFKFSSFGWISIAVLLGVISYLL